MRSVVRMKRDQRTSWIRALFANDDPPSDKVVTIYQKDIRHYSDAVQQAKELVERKKAELEASKEALSQTCQEFIDYCGQEGLQLPIAMELTPYPPKTYVFKE